MTSSPSTPATSASVTASATSKALVSDPARPVRMGIYGVGHSHAAGKARALVATPNVELIGVFEPDPKLRAAAEKNPGFAGIPWLSSLDELLGDPSVVALCVEGCVDAREGTYSAMALECVKAGKHIWYDKPAGNLATFQAIIETARARNLLVQMGYMLRYNAGFKQISDWLSAGLLGDLYAVRGHMSTSSLDSGRGQGGYPGGISFQLAPHMIDQVVWLFGGRPHKVTAFLRNDATPETPSHADNTLTVLEFERGMGMIDIAHMEVAPAARRFEVYGTRGSAIIPEPFEPGGTIRLALVEASEGGGGAAGFKKGEQLVSVPPVPRSESYHHELAAFIGTLRGQQTRDRSPEHELLVEETLHRISGAA
jgi:predicted dehydrogenase